MYVTMSRTAISAPINFMAFLDMTSSDSPVIPQLTKRHTPTGGVAMPMAKFKTMMKPKCSGSMPNPCAMGASIGASRIIAAPDSINMPTTRRKTFTSKRNKRGLSVTERKMLARRRGIMLAAITQAKTLAVDMMNNTVAVVMPLSSKMRGKSRHFISQKMNLPTKKE